MTQEQATTINPGVFSRSQTEESSEEFEISIGNGGSFSPTSWPNTTVTVANNLDKFDDKVTEINLAATNVTTLEGGVLFGNASITKLVLPATASSWKLTEPTNYQTAPVGNNTKLADGSSGSLEFKNFKNDNSNTPASEFSQIDWQKVANILNMFGRVEGSDNGKDKNLLAWKENFQGPDLTAQDLQTGSIWSENGTSDFSKPLGQDGSSQQPLYKLVNNLVWKYENSGGNITLTIHDPSSKGANLYRAGYTGNPYAYYQVGFGSSGDGKIDHTKTVEVKLRKPKMQYEVQQFNLSLSLCTSFFNQDTIEIKFQ